MQFRSGLVRGLSLVAAFVFLCFASLRGRVAFVLFCSVLCSFVLLGTYVVERLRVCVLRRWVVGVLRR